MAKAKPLSKRAAARVAANNANPNAAGPGGPGRGRQALQRSAKRRKVREVRTAYGTIGLKRAGLTENSGKG